MTGVGGADHGGPRGLDKDWLLLCMKWEATGIYWTIGEMYELYIRNHFIDIQIYGCDNS